MPREARKPVIVWYRFDLRLADHEALTAAARSGAPIVPCYVLESDAELVRPLGGASRWWLHWSLEQLDASLRALGGRLIVRAGSAATVLAELVALTGASEVHCTAAVDVPGRRQETRAQDALGERAKLVTHRGTVLFEPESVRTRSGEPYRVFSAFWRACLDRPPPAEPLAVPRRLELAMPNVGGALDELGLLPQRPNWARGFEAIWTPGEGGAHRRLEAFLDDAIAGYARDRDRLDQTSTSRLSPHLRFGELSPRQVWHAAAARGAQRPGSEAGGEAFLRELGWREFSYHVLAERPDIATVPLREAFARFPWREDAAALGAWQRGQTGFPIVDAAMRELWATGWMPNRARMITASFLVKDLLIPWQRGEEWFFDTLVDADPANNAVSWQWVAGSGIDAAPYFRVFNPVLQAKKFDPKGEYVRCWVPELGGLPTRSLHAPWEASAAELEDHGVVLGETYPEPIVDHAHARRRALDAFAHVKGEGD